MAFPTKLKFQFEIWMSSGRAAAGSSLILPPSLSRFRSLYVLAPISGVLRVRVSLIFIGQLLRSFSHWNRMKFSWLFACCCGWYGLLGWQRRELACGGWSNGTPCERMGWDCGLYAIWVRVCVCVCVWRRPKRNKQLKNTRNCTGSHPISNSKGVVVVVADAAAAADVERAQWHRQWTTERSQVHSTVIYLVPYLEIRELYLTELFLRSSRHVLKFIKT